MVQVQRVVQRAGIGVLALLTIGGAGMFVAGPATATPAAQTRYVTTNGNDGNDEVTNDCTQQAQPCKTIQHAVNEAAPGDIVSIAAGTYTEAVTIDKALTVSGAADGGTKLTATGGAPTLQIGSAENQEDLPTVTLDNLAVDDNTAAPGVVAFGANLTVQDSEINGNLGDGVLFLDGKLQVTDSSITGSTVPDSDSEDLPPLFANGDGVLVLAGSASVERSVLAGNEGSGLDVLGLFSGSGVGEDDTPSIPATATVQDSTVADNQNGGVLNLVGQVDIGTSTLSGNLGGGSVTGGGTTTILDSTVSDTQAFPGSDGTDEQGGVLALAADTIDPGLPQVVSPAQRQAAGRALADRVARQNAALGARIKADLVSPQASKTPATSVTVTGSIVAGQQGVPDCGGAVIDGGYNLSSDQADSCGFSAGKHSISKASAKLGALGGD
ncbi:MAG: hypothetical protein J0H43_06490, partial [Actinobacteria bacterium]|nr:hypothetical protein [Actinomycetota bacterium]